MPIQTAVSWLPDKYIVGQPWGMQPKNDVTATADVDADFGDGLVWAPGTSLEPTGNRPKVKLPAANTENFAGILLLEHKQPRGEEADIATLVDTQTSRAYAKEPWTIRRQGCAVVRTEEVVVPGDAVFLIVGGALIGKWRKTARGTATETMAIPRARWVTVSVSEGGILKAVLELNLP